MSCEFLRPTINEQHNFTKVQFRVLEPSALSNADFLAASTRITSPPVWHNRKCHQMSIAALTLLMENSTRLQKIPLNSCRARAKTAAASSWLFKMNWQGEGLVPRSCFEFEFQMPPPSREDAWHAIDARPTWLGDLNSTSAQSAALLEWRGCFSQNAKFSISGGGFLQKIPGLRIAQLWQPAAATTVAPPSRS